GRLTQDEISELKKKYGELQEVKTFNGLIGEFFYKPNDIIQHYHQLQQDYLSKDVLLFIKQAYMLGIFNLPYTMEIEIVKKAYLKKYNSDLSIFHETLKKIEQKGFIKLSNNHLTFSFEAVWFNEIIEPN